MVTKSFKKIASCVNIRTWARGKNWKRARYISRSCVNLFRNGLGLKANVVTTDRQGNQHITDLPLTAMHKIMLIAKEEGFEPYRVKKAWSLIDWRKGGNKK